MEPLYTRCKSDLRLCKNPISALPILGLLAFCLLYPLAGYSTDYYFSTSRGDDNRSITEAQNPDTPWKTIDKLNAVASALTAGDRVLFAAGEVFYGTINIVKGGDTGNPIVYTSYGTGAPAIITSLEEIQTWRSLGGGLYEASLPNLHSAKIQVLEMDGQLREIGSYPNAGSENRFLDIVSIASPNSLVGQANGTDWTGGEIVIRKNNWIIDRHPITSVSGSTINYETINTPYAAKVGYGYFIQNHVKALDQFGEWAYNAGLKTVTVYAGPTRASGTTVKVANRDYLVTNQAYVKNITFTNLHFKGSNKSIFYVTKSGNFTITNCTLESAGENGVYMEEVPDLNISDNTIKNSLNSGVFVFYGSPRITLRNNLVENSMPFQGMGKSSDLQSIGLYIGSDSDNSIIEKNRILNTGYNGIHFGGDYTIVRNNLIDRFCVYKQDGGGIYTNADGQTTQNNQGREIHGNIILNGLGNMEGNEEKELLAHGIYADDMAAGIKLYENTIHNISGSGIFLHNNNNLELTENTIYKVPINILASHDNIGTPIRDITIENNHLSRVFDEELVMSLTTNDYDIAEFGQLDNNYFLDPYNSEFIFHSKDAGDTPSGQTRNITSWRDAFAYDLNSNKPRFNLQRYDIVTSSPIKSSSFDSNIDIVAGTYGGVSEWLPDGIEGGSLSITPNPGEHVLTYIQIGAVEAGEEILIEFDSKSEVENKEIQLFLEKTYDDNQEGTLRYFATRLEPQKIQILFQAGVSASNESVVIKINQPSESVIFDNMAISKVTTKELNILEYIHFEYNYSDTEIEVPLPGIYRNAKNEIFNQKATIPPYGSVLLVKTNINLPDLPPSPIGIAISEPEPDETFYAGEDIFINTEINDPTGLLNRVFFFQGDTIIARVYAPPFQYTWPAPIPGNYDLKAVALDNFGQRAESELVPISVLVGSPPNLPPTVEITSPADNQSIDLGVDILVSTLPSDPDGTVDRVEIFEGNNLLGTLTEAPYELIWSPSDIDYYTLQAVVYDNLGSSGVSAQIKVNITEPPTPNQAPSIQISEPSEGDYFLYGQGILIQTDPKDPENDIDKVEFYSGSDLIGTASSAPFDLNWPNAAAGSHALKSIIYDREGLTGESDLVNISVIDTALVNFPPIVTVEEPIRESVVGTGAILKVLISIYDAEDDVERVEFYANGELVGTIESDPIELDWPVQLGVGTYLTYAVAYDAGGNQTQSDIVILHVVPQSEVNLPPTISISHPTDGYDYSYGESILVKTNPYDPENGIDNVSLYIDGTLMAQMQEAPYDWEWASIPIGTHQLYAVVTDQSGQTGTSETIEVSISNYAPSIAIVEPFDGQEFALGEDVLIKTNPIDPENEIQHVEFFYNEEIFALITEAPWEYNWVSPPAGTYTLKTKVFDIHGLTAESSRPVISVIENLAPTVVLTTPTDGALVDLGDDVLLSATPNDPEGLVERVEFYSNDGLLATVNAAPYEFIWPTPPAGTHAIRAIAFDQAGFSGESETATVTVRENLPPSITLVEPVDGQVFNLGDDVLIKTEPVDPEGQIEHVEFFYNEQIFAIVTEAPYEFNWVNPPVGTYTLKTKVFDAKGLTAESARPTIAVVENLPPTVSLTAPADGAVIDLGDDVLLSATPSDPEGRVQKVEFFANGSLLATLTAAPYEFNWESPSAGNYAVKAVVTDDAAQTGESAEATITVRENLPPSITLVEPVDGQVFNLGDDVLIKTEPVDPEGQIEHVEFFYNEQIFAIVTEAPYEFNWVNPPVGTYTLKTKVFDAKGLTAESARPTIAVRENLPPTVTLTAPADGAVIDLGNDVLLSATPSDPEGRVQKVEFFANGSLLATLTAAPYEFNWESPSAGNYAIKAVVTDDAAQTGESAEAMITVRENLPPTVTLTAPTDGAVLDLGDDVLLSATPSDPEGRVQKVEFFANGSLVATLTAAPYEFNWESPSAGNYAVKAVVTDDAAQTGESAEATITVRENLPPSITLVEPVDGQVFNLGDDVLIKTEPMDPEGEIEHVEFFYNEQIFAIVTEAPYEFNWVNPPVGTYTLKTKVFDAKGLTAESSRPTIAIVENLPPTVTLTAPTDGAVIDLGDDVLLSATPSDPEGRVQTVEFFANGSLLATLTAAPYEFNWESPSAGNYAIKAVVTDDAAQTGESAEATITVRENLPPSITLVEPVDGQVFNLGDDVLIKTEPVDPEGQIEHVEFFYNEQIFAIVTEAPYEFNWVNPPVGTYTLKTKVFDAKGLTAESSRPTIEVRSNQAPSITIVEPTDGQVFQAGENILIRTEPSDPENRIQHVEFFYNEQIFALITEPPYEFNWVNPPVGTYTLKTKVFDLDGLTAESARPTIMVVEGSAAGTLGEQPMVHASPNPAQKFVNLRLFNFRQVQTISIQVVDMTGRLVETFELEKGTSKIKVDLEDYVPGIYLFKILGDNNVLVVKKIIKH
ncbi:right-handed parallel beta-helix repeat-containing protein [Algoriphagus sp. H41]|uniref:Right-handed parallel beta-helix repeat-containing protein n=1 Tax=Algoriphagus oliviformis TaxID=2811231 RepID=A0ABS3C7U5_9BACT|nr:Ig-like domain-containing protein [Algoriphagus oliviformis]MBN7813047.1 right-handed parallel beta-helix repeat-containing protein [Algoriphagus oliviformis]